MDIDLIQQRRAEIEAKLARYDEKTTALRRELDELDVAMVVFNRFSGAKPAMSCGSSQSKPSRKVRKKPEGLPTGRQIVIEALMDAHQRKVQGLAPREIREYARKIYKYDMGSAANTVPSHLWRELGEIIKDKKTGRFSLPKKNKAPDADQKSDRPGPSVETQERDG